MEFRFRTGWRPRMRATSRISAMCAATAAATTPPPATATEYASALIFDLKSKIQMEADYET